jgi:hypothetical protein
MFKGACLRLEREIPRLRLRPPLGMTMVWGVRGSKKTVIPNLSRDISFRKAMVRMLGFNSTGGRVCSAAERDLSDGNKLRIGLVEVE